MTELNDREIWAIESLGRFFLGQERYQNAATIFRSLTRLHPDRPYSWYGLAVLYERGGDPDAAIQCYARAASEARDVGEYGMQHAEALLRLGDPGAAADLLQQLAAVSDAKIAQRATALIRHHQL